MDVFYRNQSLSALGFEYIPSAMDIGNDAVEFKTEWEEFNSRDGGMRYGERAQVKSFALRFFYDEIRRYQKEELIKLLNRKQHGELYFSDRTYAVYDVYVSERPTFEEYIRVDNSGNELLSGNVTVHFQCYKPFARFVYSGYPSSVSDQSRIGSETSIVYRLEDPLRAYEYEDDAGCHAYSISEDGTYNFLNMGTEYADVCIGVDAQNGDPGDITILNGTTGQRCDINGLTKALTYDMNRWYEVDSATGICKFTNGSSLNTISYLYHDYGYIKLAPANIIRFIYVDVQSPGNILVSEEGKFTKDMVGRYIWINVGWHRIMSFTNANTITISGSVPVQNGYPCDIATLNSISISNTTGSTFPAVWFTVTPYVR